jgi:hypothetical protein
MVISPAGILASSILKQSFQFHGNTEGGARADWPPGVA